MDAFWRRIVLFIVLILHLQPRMHRKRVSFLLKETVRIVHGTNNHKENIYMYAYIYVNTYMHMHIHIR